MPLGLNLSTPTNASFESTAAQQSEYHAAGFAALQAMPAAMTSVTRAIMSL